MYLSGFINVEKTLRDSAVHFHYLRIVVPAVFENICRGSTPRLLSLLILGVQPRAELRVHFYPWAVS